MSIRKTLLCAIAHDPKTPDELAAETVLRKAQVVNNMNLICKAGLAQRKGDAGTLVYHITPVGKGWLRSHGDEEETPAPETETPSPETDPLQILQNLGSGGSLPESLIAAAETADRDAQRGHRLVAPTLNEAVALICKAMNYDIHLRFHENTVILYTNNNQYKCTPEEFSETVAAIAFLLDHKLS